MRFQCAFRGHEHTTTIVSYDINEMLGTKMRALFQRKKGWDLFDLYWVLTVRTALPVLPREMADAFAHYLRDEDAEVPRAEVLAHLRLCLADKAGFCTDMAPLLRTGVNYDVAVAGHWSKSNCSRSCLSNSSNIVAPHFNSALNAVVCLIAQHGGFLGRKHDSEPSAKTLWLGMQEIAVFVKGARYARQFNDR